MLKNVLKLVTGPLKTVLKAPLAVIRTVGKGVEMGYDVVKNFLPKGWKARLALLAAPVLVAWRFIRGKKEEVAEETDKAVKEDTDKMVKGAEDKIRDKDAPALASTEDDAMKEMLAASTSVLEALDGDIRKDIEKVLKGVSDASEGESVEKFTLNQITRTGSFALTTLVALKDGRNEEEFKEFLDKAFAASEKSKFPIKKLFGKKVLNLFKIKLGMMDAPGLLSRFDVGILDVSSFVEALKELKEGRKSKESLAVLKRYFFKRTSDGKVSEAVTLIQEMMTHKAVSSEKFAKLVYLIDDKDLEDIAKKLSDV